MSNTQRLARFILRLFGWKMLDLADQPRKAVVIAYPHTSNWDFPWAVLGLLAMGFTPRWAGKDTMFAGWRGPIMRWLGGIPVNRRERTGFVTRMAEEFPRHDEFLVTIAPEGTRGLTEGWKSGFYRIAIAANVPVVAATIDYPKREIGFLAAIALSGNEDADIADIAKVYVGREGHTPAKKSPIRLL
jgi:1-acyl-sn-glycerol-3-phosphate acyltransferase